MKRSWLIQRLRKPYGEQRFDMDAFAFGGGMRHGGLSDDAMKLLRDVFSFDYMGAAEFEWGAVPKALQLIASKAKHLTGFSLPCGVHVLCDRRDRDEIVERVNEWAAAPYNDLKENTRLHDALNPRHKWDTNVCGWLELDNGFFFFTDADMFNATARLFGVNLDAAVTS
jgi:hypothetical protein